MFTNIKHADLTLKYKKTMYFARYGSSWCHRIILRKHDRHICTMFDKCWPIIYDVAQRWSSIGCRVCWVSLDVPLHANYCPVFFSHLALIACVLERMHGRLIVMLFLVVGYPAISFLSDPINSKRVRRCQKSH